MQEPGLRSRPVRAALDVGIVAEMLGIRLQSIQINPTRRLDDVYREYQAVTIVPPKRGRGLGTTLRKGKV